MRETAYEQELPYLLARVNRQIHGRLNAMLKEKGVPVEQWRILTVLADGKGHSMGELAEAVLMNHPTVTKTIDRMIMRALVHRRHDLDDNRRVLVYISEFGQELLKSCDQDVSTYQAALAERLGPRGAEQLRHLLDSLVPEAD